MSYKNSDEILFAAQLNFIHVRSILLETNFYKEYKKAIKRIAYTPHKISFFFIVLSSLSWISKEKDV
jgi:hypothetical protein